MSSFKNLLDLKHTPVAVELNVQRKRCKICKKLVSHFCKGCNLFLCLKACGDDINCWEKYHNGCNNFRFYLPPGVKIEETSVVLFPGQGSQFVGMGKNLLQYPGVKELYECASEILKADILKVCLEGPEDKLRKTIFTQPAILVTSLATVLKLKLQNPKMVENCVATAGFSVGEMAAMVFAGALTFEQGVQITKVRAESLQHCCDQHRSSMLTVWLSHESELRSAIDAAKVHCVEKCNLSDPVLKIASHLYAECKVVAGHAQAVEYLAENSLAFGLTKTNPILVSGAFHTPLMRRACVRLKEQLSKMAHSISSPQIPVISNVTAEPYRDKKSIPRLLSDHVVKPVKWEQTMHALFSRPPGEPFPKVYEVGPGKQLGAILRTVNRPAFKNYNHVSP